MNFSTDSVARRTPMLLTVRQSGYVIMVKSKGVANNGG